MGLHTVLGVSNISFGLPAREHITVSFLTQAMYAGLDLPIVNPNQKAIMDAVTSFRVLSCQRGLYCPVRRGKLQCTGYPAALRCHDH